MEEPQKSGNTQGEQVKVVKHIDTNRVVTKHNYLVEAHYKTTAQEQRIFHWAISEVDPKHPEQNIFRIPVSELMKLARVTNRSVYDEIQVVTDRMRSRKIDVRDLEKGEFIQASLVASVKYNKLNHTVDVEISRQLMPYLVVYKQYTKLVMEILFKLDTRYSMRIYDLMKQYQSVGHRTITVEKLKAIFELGDKPSYHRFNNLNYKIISPSIDEINRKTDIHVSYEKVKQGRQVVSLVFTITKKADVSESEPEDQSLEIIDLLLKHNVSKDIAQKWAEKYSETQIREVVSLLQVSLEKGQQINNQGGWLTSALENQWEDPVLQAKQIEQDKQRAKQVQAEKIKQAEALKDRHEKAYNNYRAAVYKKHC
jgi:plasmid replication initiation protein